MINNIDSYNINNKTNTKYSLAIVHNKRPDTVVQIENQRSWRKLASNAH